MTTAQNAMYWAEWARARDVLRTRGLTHAQAEERRHALHTQALGRDKSSKDFTNADLDAVLAAIKGIYDGGNLNAQLELGEMEARRKSGAIARIGSLRLSLGVKPGLDGGYVRGMARKLFGPAGEQYQNLDAVKLAQLEGVIVRRLRQLHSPENVTALLAEAQAAAEKVWAIVGPAREKMAAAGEEEPQAEKCPRCSVVVTIDNAGGYQTYCSECVEVLFPEAAAVKAQDDDGEQPF